MAEINISGQLHSTVEIQGDALHSHVVAEAEEILDESLEAKQSDINGSFENRIGSLEGSSVSYSDQEPTQTEQAQARDNIDVYSKNEVNQIASAFTGQNFVTVQATSGTTAADISTLINATGDGEQTDTIYRVAFFDGSAYDVTKYSEYVWNGTTYMQLNVRSEIEEIFDISVYNTSGGQAAVYDNLTVALAGVPGDVKRGGMSVKFIQRTKTGVDGNNDPVYSYEYVQYRLMATAWSTTPSNWQGVDRQPVSGSRNLAESGSVYNTGLQVAKVGELPFFEYGNINTSGVDVNSTKHVRTKEYLRAPFRLKYGEQYNISGVFVYNKVGDTYTYLRKVASDSIQNFICASDTTHYYRISIGLNGNTVASPDDVIEEYVSPTTIDRETAAGDDGYTKQVVYPTLPCTRTEVNLGTLETGYIPYSTVSGVLASSSSCYHNSPIAINLNKLYEVTTKINRLYDAGVAYYNSDTISTGSFMGLDKAFIGDGVTSGQEVRTAFLTPPKGATHVVIATRSTDNISLMEITPQEAASAASLTDGLSGKVDKIAGKTLSTNDFSNQDKEKLDSLEPGGVPVAVVEAAVEDYLDEHSGGLIPQNLGINIVPTYTYKLMPSVITDPSTLPTGWAGDIVNGFTHTIGNTDALEFDLSQYTVGDKLLVTFNANGITSESNELYVSQGTKALIMSYNSTQSFVAGFINDGSNLLLTPTSDFDGTVTNLKVRKIDQDNGTETLIVNERNVYTERRDLVAGYWNVAIGPSNTMEKAQDVTRSIAIGFNALGRMVVGNRNVAIGTYSLAYTGNADNCIAIGADTLYPTTQRVINCIAIGKATLSGNSEIEDCVSLGYASMVSSNGTKRSKCVCVGVYSGYAAVTNCVHIGYRSGVNSKGANNTSVGYNSLGISTRKTVDIIGTELTCVGYNASVANTDTAKAAVNSTAIGANATIKKSNQVVIGDSNVTEVILGGKKLIFNNDNTVTWETIS